MPGQQQTYNQGVDNHTSSEEDFSKSTQEHRSQHQPSQYGFDNNQTTGGTNEEDFSTSTQEHKSQKNTSHISPCTSSATGSEPMSENRATQPNFGGNAAGGSSYNENVGARRPEEVQNTTLPEKPNAGAGTNPLAEQQNVAGDQRVRY